MHSQAIIIPLSDLVVFPGATATIFLDQIGIQSLDFARSNDLDVAVFLKKPNQSSKLSPSRQLAKMGTLVRIIKVSPPDEKERSRVLVEGLTRTKIRTLTQTRPFLVADIEPLIEKIELNEEEDVIASELKTSLLEHLKLSSPIFPRELATEIETETDPRRIADLPAVFGLLTLNEQQELLDQESLLTRLQTSFSLIDLKLKKEQIKKGVKDKLGRQLSQQEKNYVLREELKIIQKQLKKTDKKSADTDPEIIELRTKLEKGKYPDHVKKTVEQQLERLSKQHPSSPDYAMQRDYIDWLLDTPWLISSPDKINIKKAQKVLNSKHFGLNEVKERILEFLAVRKLAGPKGGTGTILCFVGPPGVGKTSLGKSIAAALNREFVHFSLGGMRDEAEIRGHRRTYIGSMPGRIIQRLKRVGTNNPVFMLDEIDKIGSDFRGDPASALLETLDPEQNSEFNDHYLDLPFDLSKTFFITTANELDPIPGPLRDRMEIIYFSGYTESEKLEIAKTHLVPKALKQHGLLRRKVQICDSALSKIIQNHTAEAGLRNLERNIQKICRKVAKMILTSKHKSGIQITSRNLEKFLGPDKVTPETADKFDRAGISTGLAWTPVGGEILFIEAVKIPGKGNLKLTGQLGDVMKESASAAFSFLKSNAPKFGLKNDEFSKIDVHVHVPAGAIPKDGPSAGIAIFTAILSLFKNQKVPHDLAMTGEISLTGRVLPIGGLKEKALGALRAGIKTIIIPSENKKDLKKIDQKLGKKLTFKPVTRAEQVAELVFGK